ncbi:arabinan endo-1,5-alpha-L-arabinosidase [Tellurirhabdus bombi]|uniref:arabinan endo-1,5-alpha-L-arabinosidase n=1 Tax=Tellurirhabdus bombi TaxID=2907205 RepID=UPI001F16EAD1|nr:arabinan endo-1,5-alpha-L-arabinosidase [Tellurirhabdus bombi]
MRSVLSLSTLFISLICVAGVQAQSVLQPRISVHDPVMIRQDSTYYLFATGRGISVWSSKDQQNWQREKPVFETAPAWAVQAVPSFKNHIWAPDISFHNGKYYLFYSVSAFGKNTSCIGLVTNKTLNPASPDYKWEDVGKIIQSIPGRDDWNAIDPNLQFDEAGKPWLSYGSFWGGLKLVQLRDDLTAVAEPQEWYTIASRKRSEGPNGLVNDSAIEAPFIFKKDNRYYLFASFDLCCKGPNSTYKIVVGRADKITGPYVDREGKKMVLGGGTLVLQGDKNWHGVGHNSAYTFNGTDYLVFHGYDAADGGKSKLLIQKMNWDSDGWPLLAAEQ